MATRKQYGPPIQCTDQYGKGHVIVEEKSFREKRYMDGNTDTTELTSNWLHKVDGEFEDVLRKIDKKTGKAYFECPRRNLRLEPTE